MFVMLFAIPVQPRREITKCILSCQMLSFLGTWTESREILVYLSKQICLSKNMLCVVNMMVDENVWSFGRRVWQGCGCYRTQPREDDGILPGCDSQTQTVHLSLSVSRWNLSWETLKDTLHARFVWIPSPNPRQSPVSTHFAANVWRDTLWQLSEKESFAAPSAKHKLASLNASINYRPVFCRIVC